MTKTALQKIQNCAKPPLTPQETLRLTAAAVQKKRQAGMQHQYARREEVATEFNEAMRKLALARVHEGTVDVRRYVGEETAIVSIFVSVPVSDMQMVRPLMEELDRLNRVHQWDYLDIRAITAALKERMMEEDNRIKRVTDDREIGELMAALGERLLALPA